MRELVFAGLRRLRTILTLFSNRRVVTAGKDLHVGKGVRLWAPDYIRIGRGVYIGKDVHIEVNCRIGDYCLIANRVALIGRYDHDFRAVGFPVRFSPWVGSEKRPSRFRREEVVVEEDVWLGFGATILSGVRIGRGAIIAAGAVVTRDIPPYALAAGMPARVVGNRFSAGEISLHETSIARGRFRLSERGYDFCIVEPDFPSPPSAPKEK